MAQDGVIITLDINDGKLRKILTDPSGGSTTYGSWLDIFGVNGFNVSPEFTEKELAGDAATIDQYAKFKKITGSFGCQMKFSLFEVLMGGVAAYAGTTPNEKATFTLNANDLPNYFELDMCSLYRGGSDAAGGDFHFRILKCKMTKFTFSMASEEYATLQIDFAGIARLSDLNIFTLEENETAIPIEEGAADTTPPTIASSTPADNATGVVVSADLVVNFSEPILFDAGNYALTKADGTEVTIVVTKTDSDTVTINPTGSLSASSVYLLVVAGVLDLAGNMLAAPSVISFTTA